MLLSDIFEHLVYGELSTHALSSTNDIETKDYPRLVTVINSGLQELYKRFDLKTGEITLRLYAQITNYTLHTDWALSDPNTSGNTPLYILDVATGVPFTDDILLITHVYDEIGNEYALNDLNREDSVYTPTPTTLQVPYPDDENTLAVIYRAEPEKIVHLGLTDPTTVTVALPNQFMHALGLFVAFKILFPIDTGDQNSDSESYYDKFERACALINHLGTVNVDTNLNRKFGDGGWV